MFRLFQKPTRQFEVEVFVDGRHPYLSEKTVAEYEARTGRPYHYPSRIVIVQVAAWDWDDAARTATRRVADDSSIKGWCYSARSVHAL